MGPLQVRQVTLQFIYSLSTLLSCFFFKGILASGYITLNMSVSFRLMKLFLGHLYLHFFRRKLVSFIHFPSVFILRQSPVSLFFVGFTFTVEGNTQKTASKRVPKVIARGSKAVIKS